MSEAPSAAPDEPNRYKGTVRILPPLGTRGRVRIAPLHPVIRIEMRITKPPPPPTANPPET